MGARFGGGAGLDHVQVRGARPVHRPARGHSCRCGLLLDADAQQFRERDVVHFIDNTGALVGIATGYSKDVDSAHLINVFHTIAAAIMVNTWFEYVPSAANIADLPSRMDMELLEQLGSKPFDIVWPDPSEWHGGLEDLFERISRPRRDRASRKRPR